MPYADRSEEFALDGDILWRSVTPLLCIDCIAWHHPDRCIRQFGFDQRIPQDPAPAGHIESLLAADFRSSVTDWVAKYQEFVLQWEQRGSHIATGELVSDDWRHHFHDEYDEWYRRRTRLAISRGGAQYQMMVDSLERATIMCRDRGSEDDDLAYVLQGGLAAGGGYERLPERGPHPPREASREQSYVPYDDFPTIRRAPTTGLDSVDHGGRPHSVIGYAPDRHYQWSEYPTQFSGQAGASSSQPPGFTTQPSFHGQHYDRSSQPIYPPPPPPQDTATPQPTCPAPQTGPSQQWSRQEYSEDDLFRDWGGEPTPPPPPRSHGLRDRATLRPPSATQMRSRDAARGAVGIDFVYYYFR
ncbi:Serine/threonine-protein phosphatase 7 long form homolog, partial [Linum perenne]